MPQPDVPDMVNSYIKKADAGRRVVDTLKIHRMRAYAAALGSSDAAIFNEETGEYDLSGLEDEKAQKKFAEIFAKEQKKVLKETLTLKPKNDEAEDIYLARVLGHNPAKEMENYLTAVGKNTDLGQYERDALGRNQLLAALNRDTLEYGQKELSHGDGKEVAKWAGVEGKINADGLSPAQMMALIDRQRSGEGITDKWLKLNLEGLLKASNA